MKIQLSSSVKIMYRDVCLELIPIASSKEFDSITFRSNKLIYAS